MLTPEILIIASEENEHAQKVQEYIQSKHTKNTMIFDISEFPKNFTCEFYVTNAGNKLVLLTSEQKDCISFEKLHSVWWWAPGIPRISDKLQSKELVAFAYTECCQFLNAISYTSPDCLWLNQPERQEIALNPIYQLQAAKVAGFKIPETLITSHPDALKSFWDKHNTRLNYRPLVPLGASLGKLLKENLEEMENLVLAPCLFQEAVSFKKFFCVLMVGSFPVPMEVFYQEGNEVPFFKKWDLPAEVLKKIHTLMRITGLLYSSIELGLDHQENYCFLRIDPVSSFLEIQEQTKISVTEILSELLFRGKIASPHSFWPTLTPHG